MENMVLVLDSDLSLSPALFGLEYYNTGAV